MWYERRAQGNTSQSIVFYLNGSPLHNLTKSFQELGFSKMAALDLKFEEVKTVEENSMQIELDIVKIQMVDKSVKEIKSELKTTTLQVFKILVSSTSGIALENLKLIFNGQMLTDEGKFMSEYGVKNGETIHCIGK